MKNKKGFLLTEETLKIVIAVIGIALLIYLLTAIYMNSAGEKKQREATETIEKISEAIKSIEDSEKIIYGVQPFKWYLFSFVEDEKPNSCTGENCLCICRKVVANLFSRQAKECGKNGACLVVQNLNKFEKIKIEKDLTNIGIDEANGQIQITVK